MTVSIIDGPGADAAAAVIRKYGLEVEIVDPRKVLSFWTLSRAYAEGEATDVQWSLADADCRSLWRDVSTALLAQPFIDPEIVALMDAGECVFAPTEQSGASDPPGLIRAENGWMIIASNGGFYRDVSNRLAAAWLAEFDGGDK